MFQLCRIDLLWLEAGNDLDKHSKSQRTHSFFSIKIKWLIGWLNPGFHLSSKKRKASHYLSPKQHFKECFSIDFIPKLVTRPVIAFEKRKCLHCASYCVIHHSVTMGDGNTEPVLPSSTLASVSLLFSDALGRRLHLADVTSLGTHLSAGCSVSLRMWRR